MNRYLVGGAVRDTLLGRPVRDRDWVVTGETHDSMIARGFAPVGRDFPVYLHPESGEQHALARRERSTGDGHRDFTTETAGITLAEDLRRRDLTINAMAMDANGTLTDPVGGLADLRARTLRHVDPAAFAEDPLRVLRVARFAAELPGFQVASETVDLMASMRPALAALTAERVFAEIDRAMAARPAQFLLVLARCGALGAVLPEVTALVGVPEHPDYHPEGDTWAHTLLVLDAAAQLRPGDAALGWAALCHDLGKAETPADDLPMHPGHEERSERIARALLARLKAPVRLAEAVAAVCAEHMRVKRHTEMRAGRVLRMLERVGALRDPDRLRLLLDLADADDLGRGPRPGAAGVPPRMRERRRALTAALDAAVAIQGRDALASREGKPPGPWVGQVVTQMRVAAIRGVAT